MVFVVVFELIVCFLILKWLLKKKTGEPCSKKKVARFLFLGALALILGVGISIATPVDKRMFMSYNPVLAGFLTAFFTAALYEECIKYVFFRLSLLKNAETKSWLDVIIAAVILGIGFTFVENIEFAIGGDTTILRAFLPGHLLFQFFMGYFYGKARVTGQKKYDVLSLAVPILAHTLYDMPVIALKAAIVDVDLDALRNADVETIMQLPNYGYFVPLLLCVFVVAIALIVGLILAAKKISAWSKNGEKVRRIQG